MAKSSSKAKAVKPKAKSSSRKPAEAKPQTRARSKQQAAVEEQAKRPPMEGQLAATPAPKQGRSAEATQQAQAVTEHKGGQKVQTQLAFEKHASLPAEADSKEQDKAELEQAKDEHLQEKPLTDALDTSEGTKSTDLGQPPLKKVKLEENGAAEPVLKLEDMVFKVVKEVSPPERSGKTIDGKDIAKSLDALIRLGDEGAFAFWMEEAKAHPLLHEHVSLIRDREGLSEEDWIFGHDDGDPFEDLSQFVSWLVEAGC